MRPFEVVLAAAKERPDFAIHSDTDAMLLYRELEEWEAKLLSIMSPRSDETLNQLAEIRHLLGRSEPEVDYPTSREVALAAEIAKPKEISQATAKRLMEACEKLCEYHDKAQECNGSELYVDALDIAYPAIAQARAELAGEAEA